MKRVGLFLVRAYQVTVGPLFAGACRFEPSCSNYSLQALDRFGFLKGSWLTLRRLLRCRPFGPHGYDPVPDEWPGFFRHRRLCLVAAAGLLATAVSARATEPASPFELCSRLEARLVAGDGVLLPDAQSELVRFAGTIDLAEGDWPAEFLARAGRSVCVAVSHETGFYEFFDETGTVFWTVVPVLPTTDNWIAPFRHAERGTHPDDDLYASWRLVDVWQLTHAEFAEAESLTGSAEKTAAPGLRGGSTPNVQPTDLRFTAFSFTETNLFFTAVWPTNNPLPLATLDLYGSTNLALPCWTFLSSHLATNPPASFSIPSETVPGWGSSVPHVHDATCPVATNLVLSPLDGMTVYTNVVYGCNPVPTPGEAAFFRLGTRLDTDGDGLPDAFETLVSLTDPARADTDGDGLSDAVEWNGGTDPSDPDTDGDGVPDGQTATTWAENPLWAASFDDANLVVFLYEPVTNGHAALRFDDLCIPLCSNAGPWMLTIPTNRFVHCELVSGADTEVFLWYGPPEACETVRSSQPLRPGWTVPSNVRDPLWCDHSSGVFGGNRGGGSCNFASPRLVAWSDDPLHPNCLDNCYHGSGDGEPFHWGILPVGCTGVSAWCDPPLYEGSAPGTVVLDMADAGYGSNHQVFGTITMDGDGTSFWSDNVLFGTDEVTVSAHLGSGGSARWCKACGVLHGGAADVPGPGGNTRCFHLAGCAALSDAGAACTCPPVFLRVGSMVQIRLVGESGCCCWTEEYEKTPVILFASANLDAQVTNGTLRVTATGPSPTIGGSIVRYRIENADGTAFRTLEARFTCADLGIEPDLSAAYRQFDWPSDDPAEYFLAGGTLCLARRSAPYPLRLWNESPVDAWLVCALDGPEDGPALRLGTAVLAGGAGSTNAAPFAALNDDRTVYLDASCSNALSVLSLTLSDPDTGERFLRESLTIRTVDTDIGEHWRVRSATDRLSWDFSDAPAPVWIGVGTPGPNGTLGTTLEWQQSFTPSISLDLPPGDYLLEAYFPRLYAGSESGLAVTNVLHVVHTEVTPSENLRFTNAAERACFALTNNNGQVANWTISPVVAGGPVLHASKTGGAGSATHVDNATSVWVQAGTAPGRYTITATHLNCPVSTTNVTFTVGRVDVESLLFNWDTTSSTNDAINLRWNYTNEINLVTGEWTRAGYRAPACYVTNARPIVRATFSAAPADLPSVTLLAETDAAIGGFAATNVAFAGGAASDVALSTKSATTNCILKETFDLTWKAVVSNGTEVVTNTLGKTDGHVLYTILGEPVEPWNNVFGNKANAWVSALDVVCSNGWAKGAASVSSLSAMVTTAINESNRFAYDTSDGDINYTDPTGFIHFSSAVDRIRGNAGRGELVNCLDCANMVATFSNLAGAQLWTSFMGGYGFRTNPYTAIGCSPWTPPSWGATFSYHAVAWSGSCGDGDSVFDACLRYDGDGDPTTAPRREELPTGIQFSDGNPSAPYVYRERLSPPGSDGYDSCISRPSARIRFPIQ